MEFPNYICPRLTVFGHTQLKGRIIRLTCFCRKLTSEIFMNSPENSHLQTSSPQILSLLSLPFKHAVTSLSQRKTIQKSYPVIAWNSKYKICG